MDTTSRRRSPSRGRFVASLLIAALVLSGGGWMTAHLAAQNQKKEEQEDTAKPKKPIPKVEEEDPVSKPRKVIPVPDDEPMPSKPRPKPATTLPAEAQTSIVEALRETKNPELRDLYKELKIPHDSISVRSTNDETRTYAIEPLSHYYVGEQTSFNRRSYLRVWTYDEEWRRSSTAKEFQSALSIQPYEEIAQELADKFLARNPDRVHLTRAEMLKAAETVLAAADRFHASAWETRTRSGDDWIPVGQKLHERLFQIQLDRLQTFVDAGDWDGTAAYARSLADAYHDAKERTPIAVRLVLMIQNQLKTSKDAREARNRLDQLDEIFPGSDALRPLAAGLRSQAESLLELARAASKSMNHQQAIAYLELARDIYPNLPDLADAFAAEKIYQPLRVGVRDLPTAMIPGQAVTDADLRAVELLYEGLVKSRSVPGVGQRYEPALAAGNPHLIPLGRDFRIARGATWSDGTPVTSGDVKATVRAMKKDKWPGHSPLWDSMVPEPEGGGNSSLLSMRLQQGFFDPLSLMTFKVLPQSVARDGVQLFAQPLGSGPYKYVSTTAGGTRKAMVFAASPGYSSREGKLGLPRIREIHLVHFANPADDLATALKQDKIDLALDLTAEQFAGLGGGPVVREGPLPNRRVYFLAVNHRVPKIGGNVALRRALALAIDRETILDKFFRNKPEAKMHHALNGLFPAGSWPCDRSVPAELFDKDAARAQAREAVKQAGEPITLRLKYPSGDPAVHAALQDLCTSVNTLLHIDDRTFIALELQEPGVEPHKLREEVEGSHNYELAYYHYDHPSEAYWIAPLFDLSEPARDINGSNYLGYVDEKLYGQIVRAKDRRYFGEIQSTMHLIHRMMEQEMPLIPLWQLDTFVAHRKGLNLTNMDPLLIFNDVENWTLDTKP